MEKKRTKAQDAAKGIMIIAVIFFHCYLVTLTNPPDALATFNILSAIFPFLLSSFFFYTGYNYQNNGRTFKQNVIRRAKQLLIPMVITYLISTILISVMVIAVDHQDIGATFKALGETLLFCLMSQPLAVLLNFPSSGVIVFELFLALGIFWFLYTLFICSIFFYLLVNFTNKKLSSLISIVIALLIVAFLLGQFVGPYLPFTVQCYPVVLAIMLTAAYLRQSPFLNKRIRTKKESILHGINLVIAEGLIIGTCLICHYRFGAMFTGSIPGGQFDPALKGFDALITYAFGILGTYFLHTVCRLIKFIPGVGDGLQWIGNHSASFYLFHPIFVCLMSTVIFQRKVPFGPIGQVFFYVFTVMLLLTGLCFLLDFIFKKKEKVQKAVEEIENNKDPEDNI